MIFLFKENYVDMSWHNDRIDRDYFVSSIKKLIDKDSHVIENTEALEVSFEKHYFSDGTYRNKVNIRVKVATQFLKALDQSVFGNVYINVKHAKDFYACLFNKSYLEYSIDFSMDDGLYNPYSDLNIVSTEYFRLNREEDGDFFEKCLKFKKFDTSYYPYSNDKDFFLL